MSATTTGQIKGNVLLNGKKVKIHNKMSEIITMLGPSKIGKISYLHVIHKVSFNFILVPV